MRLEKEINIYGDEAVLKRFKAAETNISIVQGNISAIISESELVELQNGNATMYSKLASAVMEIDSLTMNFSDLTTKYNTVSGQYTALDSKVAQYKAGVDGLSADITQVSQNLSKNYSTTSQMNAAINAKASEITASVSSTYATNAALNTANGKISALESWKNETSLKITDSAIISTVTQSSSYLASVNSLIEQKADSIRMKATTISWSSTYSSMTAAGALTCTSGKIGGWTIGTSALYSGMTSLTDTVHNGIWLGIDGISCGKGNFKVTNAGNVTCKNIYSEGNVSFFAENVELGGIYSNANLTVERNANVGLKLDVSGYTTLRESCIFGADEAFPVLHDGINGYFRPSKSDKKVYLGSTPFPFNNLVVNGTTYTSDKNLKKDIEELDSEEISEFIYALHPCRYRWRDGESGRFHHGLIAQEVKEAMGENDWGLYVDGKVTEDAENGIKALRYEELIADLISVVQMQNKRLILLEGKI